MPELAKIYARLLLAIDELEQVREELDADGLVDYSVVVAQMAETGRQLLRIVGRDLQDG